MTRTKPPPNYDYTATARSAARRERAAERLDIALDAQHSAALQWLMDDMDLPRSSIVRRLILDEARRRGAPIE